MGRGGPDLGAVDQIAAVGLGRAGFRREQVGAGIRLAHADRETYFAAADAREDVHLDVLGRVFQKHRAALAVGDEEAPRRRVGHAHFLGHNVTFEERTLVAAIFLRPGHAEPAAGADLSGKFRHVGVFAVRLVRIESAGGDFFRKEGAHFLAQLLAFARQADWIETEGCGHCWSRLLSGQIGAVSARPPAATIHRRRGCIRACRVRPPNNFRNRNRRARPAHAANSDAGCARW